MKTPLHTKFAMYVFLICICFAAQVQGKESDSENDNNDDPANDKRLRSPHAIEHVKNAAVRTDTGKQEAFKPSLQYGSMIHMLGSYSETSPGGDWGKDFNFLISRLMLGGQISEKASFFIETEISFPGIGAGTGATTKDIEVPISVLDAQFTYQFHNAFRVKSGLMLVSHIRNGLQSPVTLMADNFGFWQYPYNLTNDQALQGHYGRDLGVQARGYLLSDKLEYRLGAFRGRKFDNDGTGPLRAVGRAVYNFLDPDKSFYYAGTNLGEGKTLSLGAGFDVQSNYRNYGVDLFFDHPAGPGSISFNGAFNTMTGGSDTGSYSFAGLIPQQNVIFTELGYYIPSLKLQPWVKYESRSMDITDDQLPLHAGAGAEKSDYNDMNSLSRIGGGITYFFEGFNANFRLSYEAIEAKSVNSEGDIESEYSSEIWAKLQLFLYQ